MSTDSELLQSFARMISTKEGGSADYGPKTIDSALSSFRGVTIALFVLLMFMSCWSIVTASFLVVAVDNNMEGHDQWHARARTVGGLDIFFFVVLLAFSAYALYVMIKYEKAMTYMVHRIMGQGTGAVVTKTAQEHLNMVATVQMPAGGPLPGAVSAPTGHGGIYVAQQGTSIAAPIPSRQSAADTLNFD